MSERPKPVLVRGGGYAYYKIGGLEQQYVIRLTIIDGQEVRVKGYPKQASSFGAFDSFVRPRTGLGINPERFQIYV